MDHKSFHKAIKVNPLWRCLEFCRPAVMVLVCFSAIYALLVAATIEGALNREVWVIPLLILTSCVVALVAAKHFARKIVDVLDQVDRAFLQSSEVNKAIYDFLRRGSKDLYWVGGIALTCSILLYMSVPSSLATLSRLVYALICVFGGSVFGFALVKYIWDYRLLWSLSKHKISVWEAHRLKPLVAYNYSLTLVALLPCLVTLYIWAATRSPELLAFAVVQGLIALSVFLWTEIRIVRMAEGSDEQVRHVIGSLQSRLWQGIQEPPDPTVVSTLAHLETIRRSLSAGNSFGLVSWADFIAKIVVPFLAGAVGVIYQVIVHK